MAATSEATFDADAFRQGIRLAMGIGAPPDAGDQVQFVFAENKTYDDADPADVPYDLTSALSAPTADATRPPVTVQSLAVELASGSATETSIGFITARVGVITILDEDYEAVKDAIQVRYADRVFNIMSRVPLGLFEVTIWQLHLEEAS